MRRPPNAIRRSWLLIMNLPASPNRIWLISFWLAISLLAGLITGVMLWILVSPVWFWLGVIIALALAGAGLLQPRRLIGPYKVWNRMASGFAHFAQTWVMRICFYTIFVAVGRSGSSLNLARPDSGTTSLWTTRETLSPSVYVCRYKAAGSGRRSWILMFLSWARGSSNMWACCLLLFFVALRAFDLEEEENPPNNIYTLY